LAAKEWTHWLRTFENFLEVIPSEDPAQINKLNILTNYVTPKVFEVISDCTTYEDAVDALKGLYIKPKNEIFARHLLATRRQQTGESLDEYLQTLKTLSKDCNFQPVTASQHCEESIRDAFINGLQSTLIRQRLLENKTLDLTTMFDQARALDSAQKSSELYSTPSSATFSAAASAKCSEDIPSSLPLPVATDNISAVATNSTSATAGNKCSFCGYSKHPRSKCPARDAICHNCQKKGHFARVCRSALSTTTGSTATAISQPIFASVSAVNTPSALSKATCKVSVNGIRADCLIDSGSTDSFIHPDIVRRHGMKIHSEKKEIFMASASFSTSTTGFCEVELKLKGQIYKNVRFLILPGLSADMVLGQDFQQQHDSVMLKYGGNLPPLVLCGMSSLHTDPSAFWKCNC
jgi:hypothetical protein